MTRFVVGAGRSQSTLFPERLEDYLSEDNPVRAVVSLSMSLICPGSALAALSPRRQQGRPIIRRCC
jgi:transposase